MEYSDYQPFNEYENLLIQLSEAGRSGNEGAARQIRTAMAMPERRLTDDMQERLDGLSADLYMLEDKEIFEPTPSEYTNRRAFLRGLQQAWEDGDWEKALAMLRMDASHISREHRAYLRAVAYESLGQMVPAQLFIDLAATINPRDVTYQSLGLDYLVRSGLVDEAADRARKSIANPEAPAILFIEAAVVLVQACKGRPANAFVEPLIVVIRALDDVDGLRTAPAEMVALAYVTLGLCLDKLKRRDMAALSYQLALRVDPRNDAAKVALREHLQTGNITAESNSLHALPDLIAREDLSDTSFRSAKADEIWSLAA